MASFTHIAPQPVGPANSLAQLCALEEVDFVSCAYQTMLGRNPDQAGMDYYLDRLQAGVSKLTILRQLRLSPEGASHDPGIGGLDRALRRHRNCNRPGIAWIVRAFVKGESDDPSARELRAIRRQLSRLESRLLGVHLDLTNRTETINRTVRLVAESIATSAQMDARSRGNAPEFGLFRVGANTTEFWSALSGDR